MQFKIPFSGRSHAYTEEELNVVLRAMQDAEPLTQGKYLRGFESAFRKYLSCEYAFAVCNATAALELAAQLCCFKPGDEVVIPSHTFTSSAYPFLKKGAKLVWADIDPETRVISTETIKESLTAKTRAVVVPHLYGFAADMPGIMQLAKEHEFLVIEDAAQAIGTEVKGIKAGNWGDFGIFSFHSHKNITTLGEGGMLTVKDPQLAELVPMLRHNGHCAFDYERSDYWIPAMGNLDLPELNGNYLFPNNYCLGEVECALGIELLKRMDIVNAEKRRRAIYFIDAFEDHEEIGFHREDSVRHNYHLLAAALEGGIRDKFIRTMANEYGIQCVVQYYPLNRYPFYRKLGLGEADCPNADNFYDNMVSFPFHYNLSSQELEYILQSARNVLGTLKS